MGIKIIINHIQSKYFYQKSDLNISFFVLIDLYFFFINFTELLLNHIMKKQVKQLCKDQGLTLEELANRVGIKRETITRALDEKKGNPTLRTIQGIAKALNVSLCKLLEGSETGLNGYVEYNGKIYKIQSVDDLEKLLGLLKVNE
jgi:transcriptional regulator with XRE-family HTH domain